MRTSGKSDPAMIAKIEDEKFSVLMGFAAINDIMEEKKGTEASKLLQDLVLPLVLSYTIVSTSF